VIVDVGVPQPVAAHANLYTRATISWYVLPAIRGRDVTRG
jgi:hypothetical protein